jgi:hypothetical protein
MRSFRLHFLRPEPSNRGELIARSAKQTKVFKLGLPSGRERNPVIDLERVFRTATGAPPFVAFPDFASKPCGYAS